MADKISNLSRFIRHWHKKSRKKGKLSASAGVICSRYQYRRDMLLPPEPSLERPRLSNPLVIAFISEKEEGDGSGTGVRTDHGAHMVDDHILHRFAVNAYLCVFAP